MRRWMWVLAGLLVLALAASPVLAAGNGAGARDGSGPDRIRQQLRDGTCGTGPVLAGDGSGARRGPGAGSPAAAGDRGAGVRLQVGRVALDELAGFLGMSVGDFRAALREGRSVAQVAAEQGKTREEVAGFLTARVKARLDEAVAAGTITQERADQVMVAFEERLPQLLDAERSCPGCPCGAAGAGGGRGGRWGQGGRGPQAPAAPRASGS